MVTLDEIARAPERANELAFEEARNLIAQVAADAFFQRAKSTRNTVRSARIVPLHGATLPQLTGVGTKHAYWQERFSRLMGKCPTALVRADLHV